MHQCFEFCKDSVQWFVRNNKGFTFMNQIKGTPAYWKKFQSEVLAMLKQLEYSTFFLTPSYADFHWNYLVEIIAKLENINLSEEQIYSLDYFWRCKTANSNPVTLVRHFQYRVEFFFSGNNFGFIRAIVKCKVLCTSSWVPRKRFSTNSQFFMGLESTKYWGQY